MDKAFLDRRRFLKLAALGAGATGLGATVAGQSQAAPVKTHARILILGAGAAGTALANRLSERLEGARITMLDPRQDHYYQPGFTLIAAGLKPSGYSVSKTSDWLPRSVEWVAEGAAEIDPEAKTVTTTSGKRLDYDYLVVATGLKLDYAAIEGMSLDLIGTNGIGSVYAGPEYAAKTWAAMDAFTETGGVGLFTRPATEMKCAGAPLVACANVPEPSPSSVSRPAPAPCAIGASASTALLSQTSSFACASLTK